MDESASQDAGKGVDAVATAEEEGIKPTSFEAWLEQVPDEISADSLWQLAAYRLALFIGDVGWHDASKLNLDRRTWGVANQLYRALGSISANISEGYSRMSSKEKARFYEYALGSARESRDWYFKGRYILGTQVFQSRLNILTRVIQLLTVMIPQQRQSVVRENAVEYCAEADTEIPY